MKNEDQNSKMDTNYSKRTMYLKAQKRIEDLKGFYTHGFATIVILPFLVFINLEFSAEFIWYGFAIAAWFVGLLIHYVNVFLIHKWVAKDEWKQRKVQELLEDKSDTDEYLSEMYFIEAKKHVKEIKGFYVHLGVTIFSIAIVVYVNLEFVPGFLFYRAAVGGMLIAIFFHWLGVYGFEALGLGKKWEQKKLKELTK